MLDAFLVMVSEGLILLFCWANSNDIVIDTDRIVSMRPFWKDLSTINFEEWSFNIMIK